MILHASGMKAHLQKEREREREREGERERERQTDRQREREREREKASYLQDYSCLLSTATSAIGQVG